MRREMLSMNIISDNALRNKLEILFKILFFVYLMLETGNLIFGIFWLFLGSLCLMLSSNKPVLTQTKEEK